MLRLPGVRRIPVRRQRAPLPEGLRARLLAIPTTATMSGPIVPRPGAATAFLASLWTSPFMPIAASFFVAVALGLSGADPYRLGAAVVEGLQSTTAPTTARIRVEAAAIAGATTDVARFAVALLPGAGRRVSRTVTASLGDRLFEDEPQRRSGIAGPSSRGARTAPQLTTPAAPDAAHPRHSGGRP